MKSLYFKYLKYVFLLLLVYVMYVLVVITQVKVGYTEMILGIFFPYIPVWLSSVFAKKADSDLSGTPLNIFALSIPLIVIALESYLIFTKSLVSDGTGAGLIGAFVVGTLTFFILFGINLILTVFVKKRKDRYKLDC